jgi:hypothetical protein
MASSVRPVILAGPAWRVVLVVIGSPVQASSSEVAVPSAVSSMRSNGSKRKLQRIRNVASLTADQVSAHAVFPAGRRRSSP